MDWGATATITAATIGLAGLVYQQSRHWRETRRDKVRDAYADWISALSRVRRTEEKFLMHGILAKETIRARAAAGDRLAQQGGLAMTAEDARKLDAIEAEIDAANRELDVTFGLVCLLDEDWRRIKAAEEVRAMPTLVEFRPDEIPSLSAFDERWNAKSKALGELASRINRTLAMESVPRFLWSLAERAADRRGRALHARIKATHRSNPPSSG